MKGVGLSAGDSATFARVGVVVPAHGPAAPLRRLLGSLGRVDWPSDRLRVVIAVDGPDAAIERAVRDAGAEAVVLSRNQGSYAARNAACDVLGRDVDIVAFTDADCIVSRGWVAAHVRALEAHELSGGAIDVTLRPRPSAAEFVDKVRHLHQRTYVELDGYAATANLAVRISVLGKVRFDADRRSGGDADFGRRARAAGFTLTYTEDATVEHPARESPAELMTKVRRICGGIESDPAPWKGRSLPRPKLSLTLAHQAWVRGLSRNPVWLMSACLLQYRADRTIYASVLRAQKAAGA
jgi:GT2 family glycosyltransferase